MAAAAPAAVDTAQGPMPKAGSRKGFKPYVADRKERRELLKSARALAATGVGVCIERRYPDGGSFKLQIFTPERRPEGEKAARARDKMPESAQAHEHGPARVIQPAHRPMGSEKKGSDLPKTRDGSSTPIIPDKMTQQAAAPAQTSPSSSPAPFTSPSATASGKNTPSPSKKAAFKALRVELGTPKKVNLEFLRDHGGDIEAASAAIRLKIKESVDLAKRMSASDWDKLDKAQQEETYEACNWLQDNGQVQRLVEIFGEKAVALVETASLLQQQHPPDVDDGEAPTTACPTIPEEEESSSRPPAADVSVAS